MKKDQKSSALSKLLYYAGSFKTLTFISLFLSVISAILSLMPYVCLWRIIREVLEVYPDFGKAADIVKNGWAAVFYALAALLVYFAALMCSHLSAFCTAGNMKRALLKHIAGLPIGFADEMGSGTLRRIVTETTAASETLLAHNLPDMAGAVTTPIVLIIMLFIFDWHFGLICLIPVILSFAAMMKMAGPGMQEDMRAYQDALEKMSSEAVEYVRGVPVVKTFSQTVFSFHRFKKSIDDYGEFCIHYTKMSRKPMMLFTVLINSIFAFILCLTLFLTGRQGYEHDILLNFLFYVIFTPAIVTTMNRVMFMSENNMLINDAMTRFESILNLEPLKEPENPVSPHGSGVELKNVSFSYSGSNLKALDNLTLHAGKNEVIAIVGASGSGKTTAAGLISRFYDADEGSVIIGGVNVKEMSKADLMDKIAYVFQDSRLLKRSIADNLRIAKPGASDDDLIAALKKAQCMDIIERLPDGINTVLGSHGTYLSGGEQQRIAIARACLKDADIIVLDEASAFADPECEIQVQKAFSEMSKDKTVIMIAHRLSTVKNADRIYVLEDGRVEEEDRHEELLKAGGLYADMWEEYQTVVNWKVGESA